MSRLTIYRDDAPGTPEFASDDPGAIAEQLAAIAVRFERPSLPVTPAPDAAPDAILAAYKPFLDQLMGEVGAGSADVIKLKPDAPGYDVMRRKFFDEHTHTEDEVRFFVSGRGNFVLHADGRVFDAQCTAGDLISVPAGIPHWFDAGDKPDFCVLRVFTDTSGWTPHYTGSAISANFPASA